MGDMVQRRASDYDAAVIVPKMEAQYLEWLGEASPKHEDPMSRQAKPAGPMEHGL
jgi:hypothetical protein